MTNGHLEGRGLGGFVGPLTEQSDPGVYVVITASRSLYVVEVPGPALPPQVTRYPAQGPLLRDETPLPCVHGFVFDVESGIGQIPWWKDDPDDYDRPDQPYAGTIRTTNTVVFIARLGDRTPISGMRFADDVDLDAVVALIHAAVRAREPDGRDPE